MIRLERLFVWLGGAMFVGSLAVCVWIASILLVLVCVWGKPIGGKMYDLHGVGAVLLGATQLAGVWLIARAAAAIDPLELAGIRSSAGSLQVGGPFRLVRHPLYLGWLMTTLGAAH